MTASLSETIKQLVTANHIVADHGVVDGFGHVSVRHSERSDHFLPILSDGALERVGPEDIIEQDENGAPLDAGGCAVYGERFIHAETYRSRPDVMVVVGAQQPLAIGDPVFDFIGEAEAVLSHGLVPE